MAISWQIEPLELKLCFREKPARLWQRIPVLRVSPCRRFVVGLQHPGLFLKGLHYSRAAVSPKASLSNALISKFPINFREVVAFKVTKTLVFPFERFS